MIFSQRVWGFGCTLYELYLSLFLYDAIVSKNLVLFARLQVQVYSQS